MSVSTPAGAKMLAFVSPRFQFSSSFPPTSSSSTTAVIMASIRTSSSFPLFLRRRIASVTTAMAAPASSSSSSSASSSASPVKPLTGIMKPVPVSADLQTFLGVSQCSRAEALKMIWAYVKEHKLQLETDKKVIVCDEKLKGILGKDKVGMLEVTKLLSPHFKKKNEV